MAIDAVGGRSGLRMLAPGSLHVTLCFLGWQLVSEIAAIGEACSVVAGMDAAELALGDPVWLPPRRPRVLAVSLPDPGGALAAIHSALSASLCAGGWYEPESRPFFGHVTVARVAKGARVRSETIAPPQRHQLHASTVTLFRSLLSPAGARYEPLRSVELASVSPP